MTPDEYTIQEHYLDVGGGHQLYVHDWGNKKAQIPIIFLHGGPGSSVSNRYRQQFVPEKQRVIFFDQRGCGKSLPYGSLENNTTQDMIEDIKKIAEFHKLDRFILTGGSWGSCLALAYGLKYPKQVYAMVLRGIFTGSQKEIDFLDKGGYRPFFPDVWDKLVNETADSHKHNPSEYHFAKALGEGEEAKKSAYIYRNSEAALLNLDDRFVPEDYEEFDPAGIRVEIQYLKNRCFMEDEYILKNARKLAMPIWLIQGRYDMVCPPVTAYELNKRLPNSELIWTIAGHGNDRPNYDVNRALLLQLTSKS